MIISLGSSTIELRFVPISLAVAWFSCASCSLSFRTISSNLRSVSELSSIIASFLKSASVVSSSVVFVSSICASARSSIPSPILAKFSLGEILVLLNIFIPIRMIKNSRTKEAARSRSFLILLLLELSFSNIISLKSFFFFNFSNLSSIYFPYVMPNAIYFNLF